MRINPKQSTKKKRTNGGLRENQQKSLSKIDHCDDSKRTITEAKQRLETKETKYIGEFERLALSESESIRSTSNMKGGNGGGWWKLVSHKEVLGNLRMM